MMKVLLLAAILANGILLVSSGSSTSSQSSSSSSSSSSSQFSSLSSSYSSSSSSTDSDSGDCSDNDDGDVSVDSKTCGANETYLECPEAQCVARKCSELGFPISCPDQPKDGSCPGKPGCVCIDGFVRDENNVCIPSSECPSCGGDKNKRVGCGVYCNQHCSDIGAEPKACILICYANACDCKPGFYLNSKGDCVKPDQCDVGSSTSSQSSSSSSSSSSSQSSSSSSSYSTSSSSTDTDSGECSDNDDGDVSVDSKTCGANETYLECPEAQCVARKCSELGFPISCPDQPKDGSCPGKPGCVCIDGFVRDENNVCIPSSECPSCGGDKNKRAGCGVYCNQHCSDIGAEPKACILICYANACDCKPGFYLNSKGDCVKPDQCDVAPKCKKNEVFSNCTNGGCEARNCSQLGAPVPCVKLDPAACKKGCICVDGYLRAANGTCIPKDQCPSCGGDPNAKPGCGVNCGRRCSTYKIKSPICPRICKVDGCDCKDKYVFDDNLGKCVLPEDCTRTCQDNEVFSNCTNGGCSARNCSQLGLPVPCVKLDPAYCKKGCVCKEDYLRAANGTCIPKTECPTCGGDKNKRAGCGVYCNQHCSDIGAEPKACILICYENACDCRPGFYLNSKGDCVKPDQCDVTPTCKKNEVFSNCTNGGCDARNCSQLGAPVPCVKLDPAACKKGCVCVDGYLRAANGTCIPKDQCPSCGGDPNAKPGCGVNCGRRCSTYKIKSPICPKICKVNGCDCKDKYVFDDNLGKCVLPEDCTPTCKVNEVFSNCINGGCSAKNCSQLGLPVPCVKLNPASCKKGCVCKEDYLRAANGTCIPKTECPTCGGDKNKRAGCGLYCNQHCSDIGAEPKACILICNPNACDCKPGFYLNSKRECVKPDQCDVTPTCKKNEVFSNCTNGGCDARNCSQLGAPVPCVKLDPAACKKGCVCVDGYLRAANGTCIPKDQCPSCGGDPNAKPGCGVNCGRRCSTYKSKSPICPKICKVNGCDCKDKYVFDDNLGKCVLPKDCTPTCKVDEVFSNCTNSGCDARNCSQLGYPVRCVDIDPASCTKGCVCKQDYLRAKNGTCIPRNECPSCGGDPNAKPGCGVHCGNTCSTYKKKPVACRLICQINGCDCKENYVYDTNIKKCVLPKDCTPTCKVNEVFSNCINSGCDARTCSQLGYPVPCLDIDPASCKKGCVCKQDYLWDKNGTCIPRNECPSCGGDPNAKPGCGDHCGNTCSTYKKKPVACPQLCLLNGCDCKENYVYDNNIDKCVLPKDCTPTCQLHEVYSSCANVACVARNCTQYGKPMPDHCVPPRKCIGGCVCGKGYLRARNGTCIPQEQCKSSTTTTTTTTTTVAPSTGQCSNEDDEQSLTTGNIDFTVNFLYEMIKLNAGKSIVMSPFSCFIPFAQMALYTEPGESYNQLMGALNLNNTDQIRTAFLAYLSLFKNQEDIVLDLAGKIYVNKDVTPTPKFEDDSLQIFGAKPENVDFSDPQKAADIINAWVKEVTRGLIENLVSPSMFSPYTRLVLLNAIYFLGNWQIQFNPNNTQTKDFYVTSENTVQVPLMYRKGSFRYAENSTLDCKILEIPYKGGNFSYVIFLPNEVDGCETLAEKLKDPVVLNQALDSLSYQTCQLYLPRHHIASSIDLKAIFQTLNITGIFNPDTAKFSGILEGNEPLSVSSAIQKADIEVTEVGTEAAAVNAIIVGTTAVHQPQTVYTVKADHPFLFFLFLKRNPMFCGVYAGN